jgi:hypothetical protein
MHVWWLLVADAFLQYNTHDVTHIINTPAHIQQTAQPAAVSHSVVLQLLTSWWLPSCAAMITGPLS